MNKFALILPGKGIIQALWPYQFLGLGIACELYLKTAAPSNCQLPIFVKSQNVKCFPRLAGWKINDSSIWFKKYLFVTQTNVNMWILYENVNMWILYEHYIYKWVTSWRKNLNKWVDSNNRYRCLIKLMWIIRYNKEIYYNGNGKSANNGKFA